MASANSIEKKSQGYVERIEDIKASIEFEREKFKKACEPYLEDIKEIYAEAKEADIPLKPLRKIIRRRDMERKIAKLPENLDLSEQAIYDGLVEAFGPLGQAAADRAGYKPAADKDALAPAH